MKQNLDEISLVRLVLIIVLVLYHSFAPWCEAWRPFPGYTVNETYWWIGTLSYSFMLPAFVFMSGYIYAFQRETLRRNSFKSLVVSKIKRLYMPSIIFSVLYLTLIAPPDADLFKIIKSTLEGAGHMWFLPMLFWCFIFMHTLLNIKARYFRLLIILCLAIFNVVSLPLQMKQSCFYLLYFYIGYECYLAKDMIRRWSTNRNIIISWTVFLISFIALTLVIEQLRISLEEMQGLYKAAGNIAIKLCKITYSFLGVFSLYITAMAFTIVHRLHSSVITLGKYCFGVYLFQQFILQALYYHTRFPQVIGNVILPWVGFAVSLIISLLLSYWARLTKLGRTLI